MADEFDEAEVVFSESSIRREDETENSLLGFKKSDKTRRRIKKTEKSMSTSLPVNIPENMFTSYVGKDDDQYSDEVGEFVPPHIIAGRKEQMAFSVCTGIGRTLKGRDLSRVRNSVLRLTGFLEA